MNKHAPLGAFEEQVLVAILRTGDDAFGMNVRREIETITGREVAIGAVYATLDRLEAKKLARSLRSSDRRVFEVTRTGLDALAQTKAMRERLWKGINVLRLLENS